MSLQSPTGTEPTVSAIGAQPLDSDLSAIAALSTTAFGRAVLEKADAAALLAAAGGQASDSDLAAIAALSTTSYGRALLAVQDQAALVALLPGYQPIDAEVTAVAALDTSAANAGKVVGVLPGGGLGLIVAAAMLATPAVVEGPSWTEFVQELYAVSLDDPTVVESPSWSA